MWQVRTHSTDLLREALSLERMSPSYNLESCGSLQGTKANTGEEKEAENV